MVGLLVMSLLAAFIALAALGCTSIKVEGWSVDCQIPDQATCKGVVALALNNLARNRPANPTGTITVTARGSCPAAPDWADASQCWNAFIPLSSGEPPACLVVARRPVLGGFGQVGGDDYSGLARIGPPPPPGCP